MSNPSPDRIEARWLRPQLERSKPIRTAAGFYRTAEGGRPGVGGVPLTAAEDSVVAAVRLAYNVAEAQIERSARLARRLREAGDRAVGARSDRKAVDAVEQLMLKAIQGALVWLERTADDPDPVKRLLVAQYRLAGSMLGLTPSDAPRSSGGDAPERSARSFDAAAPSRPERGASHAPAHPLKVVLKGQFRRPVRITRYEVASGALRSEVKFYSVTDIESDPLKADLAIGTGVHDALSLEIPRLAKSGLWKAAVCDSENVQIGVIEIEL
jgi:hypothetical protein